MSLSLLNPKGFSDYEYVLVQVCFPDEKIGEVSKFLPPGKDSMTKFYTEGSFLIQLRVASREVHCLLKNFDEIGLGNSFGMVDAWPLLLCSSQKLRKREQIGSISDKQTSLPKIYNTDVLSKSEMESLQINAIESPINKQIASSEIVLPMNDCFPIKKDSNEERRLGKVMNTNVADESTVYDLPINPMRGCSSNEILYKVVLYDPEGAKQPKSPENIIGTISLQSTATLKEARIVLESSKKFPPNFEFWFARMQCVVESHQESRLKVSSCGNPIFLKVLPMNLITPSSIMESSEATILSEPMLDPSRQLENSSMKLPKQQPKKRYSLKEHCVSSYADDSLSLRNSISLSSSSEKKRTLPERAGYSMPASLPFVSKDSSASSGVSSKSSSSTKGDLSYIMKPSLKTCSSKEDQSSTIKGLQASSDQCEKKAIDWWLSKFQSVEEVIPIEMIVEIISRSFPLNPSKIKESLQSNPKGLNDNSRENNSPVSFSPSSNYPDAMPNENSSNNVSDHNNNGGGGGGEEEEEDDNHSNSNENDHGKLIKESSIDVELVSLVALGMKDFFDHACTSSKIKGGASLKEFITFVKLFGPLEHVQWNVYNTYREPFFHGFITLQDAQSILRGIPGGFLIRFSQSLSNKGYFVLNVNKGNDRNDIIENYAVRYLADKEAFLFLNKHYATLRDLTGDPTYTAILKKVVPNNLIQAKEASQNFPSTIITKPPINGYIELLLEEDETRLEGVKVYLGDRCLFMDANNNLTVIELLKGVESSGISQREENVIMVRQEIANARTGKEIVERILEPGETLLDVFQRRKDQEEFSLFLLPKQTVFKFEGGKPFDKHRRMIIKQGWLTKKGEMVKNWKLRFFILCKDSTTTSLEYFENEEARKPLGRISFAYIEGVIKHTRDPKAPPFSFDVITPHRIYVLSAQREEELLDWVNCIQLVLHGQ